MDSFVLEDWTTIRGAANITVTQGESSWLDLGPYEDVVFWLLCSEAGSGVPSLLYQTSPTKDEAFFAAQTLGMNGSAIALAASSTPIITPVLAWSAPFPLARYVRWQILGPGSTFDVTMRIVVAAVAPRQ
jgi:hypothetical protein